MIKMAAASEQGYNLLPGMDWGQLISKFTLGALAEKLGETASAETD
ncbi:hypothetical protein RUE5091_01981 [Ruegeria denitrificans]|uniref:Uncharacterized protein n=1 Tax=Ruegeria denitrificans TaxID=1715692 RepID=A0A0P1I949_9RHOB|nr:hypothetical protein [Ruegeria denitrificans]CUJ98911.1 hypothetical protein RUE5091_01981 [Ruegeria denitrificans]